MPAIFDGKTVAYNVEQANHTYRLKLMALTRTRLEMTKKAQAVQPKRIITASPNDPIMKLVKQVGIEDIASDVINAIISPLIGLIANQGNDTDSALNTAITLISAAEPKNQLELMLATQLAITHITLGKSARVLDGNNSQVNTINSLGNLYTKLSRLSIDQIHTLERLKGKGQQKIIVEKVNIESGGQAAIGVYEGVGLNAKK
jgi:hypothetical protein